MVSSMGVVEAMVLIAALLTDLKAPTRKDNIGPLCIWDLLLRFHKAVRELLNHDVRSRLPLLHMRVADQAPTYLRVIIVTALLPIQTKANNKFISRPLLPRSRNGSQHYLRSA